MFSPFQKPIRLTITKGKNCTPPLCYMIEMSSETYRRFLRLEAESHPVKIDKNMISWENINMKIQTGLTSPSDILESIYLKRDMSETVVMDRRVASLLRDKLAGLEAETEHLRRRIKFMKFIILGLSSVLLFMLWILLNVLSAPALAA